MEDQELDSDLDSRLIGGAELIASVVFGGILGRKGHGVVEGGKKPSVSKVESGSG